VFGDEHPLAVELLVGGYLGFIQGYRPFGDLEETPVARVAHELAGAALELVLELGDDGLARELIFPLLLGVEAHYVAPALVEHLFHLEVGLDRGKAARPGEHVGHGLLLQAHLYAQYVGEAERGESLHVLLAHHSPVGDYRHITYPEPFPQGCGHRHDRFRVGGVARPHGAGDGTAVLVCDNPHHHLVLIGPAVLGVASGPQLLAARALEVDAGGVEEDHRKGGEEVPVGLKDGFLDGLTVLAQPGHGPVEVVELYVFCSGNAVVAGYPGGFPVRAGEEKAGQRGEVDRPLYAEGVIPAGEQRLDPQHTRLERIGAG